jgi:hypothetical protein
LTGTVTDNSGAIALAAVAALNTTTGIAYRTRTTETGTYVLQLMRPGIYILHCEQTGFN